MKPDQKKIQKKRFANIFGVFGYLSCSLQWFWSIILYFGIIISVLELSADKKVEKIIINPTTISDANTSYIMIIFGIIIAILMLIVAIYVLIKIPKTIAKTEKKIVHETAAKVAPFIIKYQKKKDNQKNRLKLTAKLILIIKTQLVVLPIFIALLSKILEKPMLDFQLAVYISLILAGFSVFFFFIQYSIARLFKIDNKFLW